MMQKQMTSNRGAAIGGMVLIVLGVMALLNQVFPWFTALLWAGALGVAGAVILMLYQADRSQWWMLIPVYVLWVVAAMIVLIDVNILRDEIIATYVLYAIGFPFLYSYLKNRENWGLLIPAYVMFAVGTMVMLIGFNVINDELIASYVMFAIAAPFLLVYAINRRNWWALIPGGIMASIGIAFLLGAGGAARFVLPAALILGGAYLLLVRAPHENTEVMTPLSRPAADKAPAAETKEKAPMV